MLTQRPNHKEADLTLSHIKKENQIEGRDDLQSTGRLLGYAVLFEGFQCNHCFFFSLLLSQHEKQESKITKTTQLGHTIFSTIFVVSGFILCVDSTCRTSRKSGQRQLHKEMVTWPLPTVSLHF